MVRSAASLIRRRGLSRASFADIVADSGAPRGSIYHHFPQGKDQLAKEAIRATSDWVLAKQGACAAKTPVVSAGDSGQYSTIFYPCGFSLLCGFWSLCGFWLPCWLCCD